jgi:hypothetical protein
MATVATIGHYGIYVALPQGSVDGPGIADVMCTYSESAAPYPYIIEPYNATLSIHQLVENSKT